MTHADENRLMMRFMLLSVAAALVTIAMKVIAAWLTGSVGLLSDALESGVNLVAAVVGLIALRVAAKPADYNHQFDTSAMLHALSVVAVLLLQPLRVRLRHAQAVHDVVRDVIPAVVHQRIMQAAKRRAGIDRDVFELECFQQIDDHVRTPLGARLFHFLCFAHNLVLSWALAR